MNLLVKYKWYILLFFLVWFVPAFLEIVGYYGYMESTFQIVYENAWYYHFLGFWETVAMVVGMWFLSVGLSLLCLHWTNQSQGEGV